MKNYMEQAMASGQSIEDLTPINILSYKELLEKLEKEPKRDACPSGLKELDEIIGGLDDGRMYVLSAPTKMGKTTLAQTLMYNMAFAGVPSLFFSYEMGWQEVVEKYKAMDGKTGNKETSIPLFMPIDLLRGGGELQYQWLYDAIAKAKEEKGIRLVVIDHLHFLLPLRDFSNTSFIIGGIVREIKKMSVALKIPIILIAHTAKIKDDRKPDWTDIRDSSFITQEADVVLMMYRLKNKEEKKKITDDSVEETYTNKAMLSVELDRVRGNTGKVLLWHNGAMFEPYDKIKHGIIEKKMNGICTNLPVS